MVVQVSEGADQLLTDCQSWAEDLDKKAIYQVMVEDLERKAVIALAAMIFFHTNTIGTTLGGFTLDMLMDRTRLSYADAVSQLRLFNEKHLITALPTFFAADLYVFFQDIDVRLLRSVFLDKYRDFRYDPCEESEREGIAIASSPKAALIQKLIEKLPDFDLMWSERVQEKWFDTFDSLARSLAGELRNN